MAKFKVECEMQTTRASWVIVEAADADEASSKVSGLLCAAPGAAEADAELAETLYDRLSDHAVDDEGSYWLVTGAAPKPDGGVEDAFELVHAAEEAGYGNA